MKIKVLALMMALLIVLLSLAACVGNEDTTTANEITTTANEITTAASEGEKATVGDYYETDEVLGEELPME